MPKHNFEETTTINNKVFFEGEAEVSDADLKALKDAEKREYEVAEGEESADKTTATVKKGK